ncbi:protein of unknown function (DUF1390) [Paramecium bursaria Chlorella virus CVR-1]|nr:protein of unknown function (DUF1390) [Paramecium bursaria Chlorella virus CVR-1]
MDIPADKTFTTLSYKCSHCGYETNHSSHSARHKKTLKCENPNMTKVEVQVMKIEDVKELMKSKSVDDYLEDLTTIVATKTDENDKLTKIIQQQRKTLLKISETYKPDSDDEDNEDGVGIIYYITDKDLPSRGKIGRTKNTDLKKLKSRYSTFSKPGIMCFYSTDIKKDENDLKTMLKEHGCMDASIGKETVVNCAKTRALFHDFASR